MNTPADKTTLRRKLRIVRRTICGYQRRLYQRRIAQTLSTLPALRFARRIAGYIAFDGEPDVRDFLRMRDRKIWLPRVNRDLTLHFRPAFDLNSRLPRPPGARRNQFGILESHRHPLLRAGNMDALLIPLVGFDEQGNRLGMGAGYYDRSLANLRHPRPLLIGIAFSSQQVEQLPVDPWDIPLDYIVTNKRLLKIPFRPRNRS
ncbi:MAG: 5-formyltetrahydrofolate cyclo-ligase [Halothiobacillus sp.]|jgi:5-formyltetrahydrofolate cyclo-ligase|uniref:5-formyltetrahydrofolate cyclo-ligase n=1 Tax=Halothiobacillus sp. TaxID=1891311 RepID=UPI002AD48AC6|nr:5-formyltetrahydrofolate cyclo-ligase [Halothiobacillus sp.]MDA3878376.1 5-formyltetrahydrofolate cyclo-ligase [Halothiobacillus sp.]